MPGGPRPRSAAGRNVAPKWRLLHRLVLDLTPRNPDQTITGAWLRPLERPHEAGDAAGGACAR